MAWKILIVGLFVLAIYFGYQVFLLVRALKKLAHAASGFGAAFSPYATAHLRKYVASRSVWEDPQRIVAALAVHAQIKDTRQCNRQRRFTLATDRWMQSDSASYSRIDTPARMQAKNYRAARKENLRTEK
ncbi:hypothetical protein [Arcanobacterium hippocoleae]|uniref:Uncharacterized protein n=1 Tax=Arcanobacterium hippocoleae TaxID=149017 RepID=A0ABU1T096_9ACTO|nr:hypothetical protein [Arcanobacterium hippocoleae]MDR6938772.1 hypothetical protein [Arcanobacterium hippocoleae]